MSVIRARYTVTRQSWSDGAWADLAASSSGALITQPEGGVASGAADSGNPIKVAGRYNSTLPTLTNGQRGDLQLDSSGRLLVRRQNEGRTGADSIGNTSLDLAIASDGSNVVPPSYVFNGTTWDRMRGDTGGSFVKEQPKNKSSGGGTATTTSAQVFAANAQRNRLIIQNQDAAINIFINLGTDAVANQSSLRIAPGETLQLQGTSAAVNIISASGTPTFCAWEF